MSDLEIWFLIISILILSITHTFGEVLYKKGSMLFMTINNPFKGIISNVEERIMPLILITISIGISLMVKIIYGILLVTNPLSVSSGLFLGFIAIFSVVFGKIFFNEKVTNHQGIGVVLIALGIIILV